MKALILVLAMTAPISAHAESITLACGDAFFQDTDFTVEVFDNRQEGLIKFRGERTKHAIRLSAQTSIQDDRGNAAWNIYAIEGLNTGIALPGVLLKNQSKLGMMKNAFASAEKAIFLETQKGEFVSSDTFGEISCVRTK